MVHIPAKFRKNTSMPFRVTVRKQNMTDGGHCNISHPGPSARREIIFFQYLKTSYKKSKQHSINIKNYTAHPHDIVHIPAKFRENTSMRFRVAVQNLNMTDGQTDGQTDGGRCNISRPRPAARREIKIAVCAVHQFLTTP